jgi:predicted transcriptional regulator
MEITIKLPEVLAEKARSSGLAPDVYVERLLGRIADISSRKNSARAQLRSELAEDWEQFQASGLHLDDEEVDVWLAGVESGRNSDPPELHA